METDCKLYIGCVSRNTIDAAIEYSNEHDIPIGLIPSRRQVDYDGGYIGFTSQKLHDYVRTRSNKIVLQRDHGGPSQGKILDDGFASLIDDCKYYDLIHIDPWKQHPNIVSGIQKTKELIDVCLSNNYGGKFEISTEQSIREFTVSETEHLIKSLIKYPIQYVVIQSGTSLKENKNTGLYDQQKLKTFCKVVSKFNLLSKEHNGDYMDNSLIKSKFANGLHAINIAPEFGFYESRCYIESIKNYNVSLLDKFYDLCYDSNHWKKWVNYNFDITDKEKLILICGHYVLENNTFVSEIKNKLPDLSFNIKSVMKNKMDGILS